MLDELVPQRESHKVIHMSSVGDSAVKRLMNMGVAPASFPEILNRMRRLGIVFGSDQIVDRAFQPSTNPKHPTPFRPSRFTAGDKPVFYTALDDATSIEEMGHQQVKAGAAAASRHGVAYYWVYEADFGGLVLDFFQIKSRCPELTSADESGYPKCQELAEGARRLPVNGVRTPSARNDRGTCLPVFDRGSVGRIEPKRRGKLRSESGHAVFEDS